MTRFISLILLILLSFNCRKKEEPKNCTDEHSCLGKHNFTITDKDKSFVTVKDTIYKFVGSNNDTISLKFRATNFETLTSKSSCACQDKSTDLSFELISSIYKFNNKDLALKYMLGPTYPENQEAAQINSGNITLDIRASDTNAIIYNIFKSSDRSSVFTSNKYNLKHNDFDSLMIGNKYFYNIINTFDNVEFSNTAQIKDIFYSRNFGLVRFKYNTIVYDVVH